MKYCLTKHAIIEDNGDLVATFNSCIPSGQAYKLIDILNEAKSCESLEHNLDVVNKEYRSLERDIEDLEDEIDLLKANSNYFDNKLQCIITMLENDHGFKTMEEMAEEIIAICAKKL